MRLLVVFLLSALAFHSMASGFDEYFRTGLIRVDFYRHGDAQQSDMSLRRTCYQNWYAGSHVNLVESMNFGSYRFEVLDSASNVVIYANGYSSLFNEWIATDEAKIIKRSFEESITLPCPKKPIIIVFYKRLNDLKWIEEFRMNINPDSKFIERNHFVKYPVKDLSIAGPTQVKLDLLFIPEGYTSGEMAQFKKDAENAMNSILKCAPFGVLSDYISFRAVMAPSNESGTDYPGDAIWVNTLLNSTFFTFNTERYLTTSYYHTVMDVAANAPADHIIILANDNRYGGAGFYHFYTMACARNSETPFLILHELGHGLAGLADEYYTSDVAVEEFYNLKVEPWEPNITTLIDFKSKWLDMLADGFHIPSLPSIDNDTNLGVYEGGGYVAKGIYRPRMDCTMKSVRYNYFCPVCQRAIIAAIKWETE